MIQYIPEPGSPTWIARVGALIRDGFGSEDIAVKLSCRA